MPYFDYKMGSVIEILHCINIYQMFFSSNNLLQCYVRKISIYASDNLSAGPQNPSPLLLTTILTDISVKRQWNLGHYLAGLIEGDGAIIVPSSIRSPQGETQKCQMETFMQNTIIEWIPYNKLQNIE